MRNPGQKNRSGLAAGVEAHAVGFRAGEMNRPAALWTQLIASSFTRVGYPVVA